MTCPYFPAPFLLFFSTNVPPLLYYSHIPILIVSVFIGIFVLIKDKGSQLSRALVTPLFLFSVWLVLDLITWTSNSSDNIMFVWSFFGILFILINFFFLRFLYFFIINRDVPFYLTLIIFILTLPVIIFTFSSSNLSGFDTILCSAVENNIFLNYYYFVGILIFIYICFFIIKNYLQARKEERSKILFIGLGTTLFLFLFLSTGVIVTVLKYLGLTKDYQIEQYGFFPILIFIVFLAYAVIKYKILNIKLISTQALVFSLIFLIGSQFFVKVPINFVLNGVTFVGVVVFGFFLVKSVKKEIQQKEHLERISALLTDSKNRLEETNMKLEDANDKLKSVDKLKTEFLSLASHQLRSPLTAIKGYTSMLLEGDFGTISAKQKEAIDRVYQSSKHLTVVVEDLLNVAKIEQGGMQYIMRPFDLEKIISDIVADMSVVATEHSLKLSFKTDKKGPYNTNGDMEKIRQVVMNFIDNAIKYTKKGSIIVKLEKDENRKKLIFSVTDTGMGIPPEIKETLFAKFSRGNGGMMDATGTGLGLYLAKEIIEGHKGKVWAESPGTNQGSTFFMELKAE